VAGRRGDERYDKINDKNDETIRKIKEEVLKDFIYHFEF